VQKAVELMSLVPKCCNDMMNLGRLQGYEVHPTEQNMNRTSDVYLQLVQFPK